MIHYTGKDVKGSPVRESLRPVRESLRPVKESLKPREGIPKASIGIVLVDSQQAAVYFMCFWP